MVWRRIYAKPLTEPINTVYQFTDTNMRPDRNVWNHQNWHSKNPQMVYFENKQRYFFINQLHFQRAIFADEMICCLKRVMVTKNKVSRIKDGGIFYYPSRGIWKKARGGLQEYPWNCSSTHLNENGCWCPVDLIGVIHLFPQNSTFQSSKMNAS